MARFGYIRSMATNQRIASATDAVEAIRSNPYLQKVLSDEQLHDDVRSAIGSAKSVMDQMQSKASVGKKMTNDKLYDELQSLAKAVRDASEAVRDAPSRQRSGGGFVGKLAIGAVGAV